MKKNILLICVVIAAATHTALAQPLSGTYQFVESATLDSATKAEPPPIRTIKFESDQAHFTPGCTGAVKKIRFEYDEVFQLLMKQGINEQRVRAFLLKKFGLRLSKDTPFYELADKPERCASPISNFFATGREIIVASSGDFYRFVKSAEPLGISVGGAGRGSIAGAILTPEEAAVEKDISQKMAAGLRFDPVALWLKCADVLAGLPTSLTRTDRCGAAEADIGGGR